MIVSLIALLALALPNCSTARSGMALLGRCDRGEDRVDRGPSPRVESPATSKSTRAAWPSSDTALSPCSGDFTFSTYGTFGRLPRHVLDRGLELRVLDGELVALDEHDLGLRPKPGAIERHLGVVGLAVELVDVGDQRSAPPRSRSRTRGSRRRASPRTPSSGACRSSGPSGPRGCGKRGASPCASFRTAEGTAKGLLLGDADRHLKPDAGAGRGAADAPPRGDLVDQEEAPAAGSVAGGRLAAARIRFRGPRPPRGPGPPAAGKQA